MSEKFWRSVDRSGDCWVWLGKLVDGYGSFYHGTGKTAHRYSWVIHNGPIPVGMYVCHKCDNRACVNPEHLFLGTAKDNMHDMIAKNRQKHSPLHGERNGQAKLTAEQVKTVRHLYYAERKTQRELAEFFGVHLKTIISIVHRKTWRQYA